MIPGSQCFCGWSAVPPRENCLKCKRKMDKTEFTEMGEVLTYTVENVVPEGFTAPLYLAMIKLVGNPKVLCAVKEGKWLKIGKDVFVEEKGGLFYARPATITGKIAGFVKRTVEILRKRRDEK